MNDSQLPRSRLLVMALVRLVAAFVILLGMLLLSAGTVAYWEAWVYMVILFVPITLVLFYLLWKDPGLLERRMRAREREEAQGLIVKLGSFLYLLIYLLPGLDRRFGWSEVPVAAVIIADILILLGYGLFVLVLRENSYASRVVEVEAGQRVIATGPYAVVRHPMYAAAIVIFIATPVALGSWWALLTAPALVAFFVARIRNEEQVLLQELEGYSDYLQTTRYRLVPGVW